MTDSPSDLPPDFDLVEFRRRQQSRARIMGACLLGLAILFFGITIARIGMQ